MRIGEGEVVSASIFFLILVPSSKKQEVRPVPHTYLLSNPDLALGTSYLNCDSSSK